VIAGLLKANYSIHAMTSNEHDQFKQAFSNGHLEEAEQIVLCALERASDDWNAIYLLGIICRARGDFRGALTRYHEALQFTEHQAPIIFRACGIAHQQLEEFDKAISAFTDSLREEPNNIEGLNSLALTYRKINRFYCALYYYCIALNQCLDASYSSLKQTHLIKETEDANDKKGTLLSGESFEEFRLEVLTTPYFTILENIGAVYDAADDSSRAKYFFDLADTKTPADVDLMLKIFKEAERSAGLQAISASL
jgi:tetratricopeptide (TPR) repeat protein